MIPIALLSLIVLPEPISLDGISIEHARSLRGKLVAASFLVAKPNDIVLGRTVIGAADRDDGAERIALLKGKRLDKEVGQRVTVIGKLRVIDHPPYFAGRELVPRWLEIRVEE